MMIKKRMSLIIIFFLVFVSFFTPVVSADELNESLNRSKFLRKAIDIVPEKSKKKIITNSESSLVEDFITGQVTLNTHKRTTINPRRVEDYHIYKGSKYIDLVTFLKIVDRPDLLRKVKQKRDIHYKTIKFGLATAAVGGLIMMNSDKEDGGAAGYISGGGFGLAIVNFFNPPSNYRLLDYQKAIRIAEIYNAELREGLGLAK